MFVKGIGSDNASEVIIDAILTKAHGLGVSVVAEGIETQMQADLLIARGYPMGQRNHFGKAVTAEGAEI